MSKCMSSTQYVAMSTSMLKNELWRKKYYNIKTYVMTSKVFHEVKQLVMIDDGHWLVTFNEHYDIPRVMLVLSDNYATA